MRLAEVQRPAGRRRSRTEGGHAREADGAAFRQTRGSGRQDRADSANPGDEGRPAGGDRAAGRRKRSCGRPSMPRSSRWRRRWSSGISRPNFWLPSRSPNSACGPHFDVVTESLRDDIRLIATRVRVARPARLVDRWRRGRRSDDRAAAAAVVAVRAAIPTAHTDQLVWVLNTPICDIDGCTQIPAGSRGPSGSSRGASAD